MGALLCGSNPWNRRVSTEKTQRLTFYEGLRFHELRRSGVRNLTQAGVDDKTIMLINDHKTDAILRRHDIVDEEIVREAWGKLSAHMKKLRRTKTDIGGQAVDSAASPT